jgi:hypothetical protein
MSRKLSRTVLASAAFTVGSAGLVQAGNLVTNGGFETGDFTGWTLSGDQGSTGVCDVSSCPGNFTPYEGSFAAYSGGVGHKVSLSQEIATTPGQFYKLDFFLANPVAGDLGYFEADWDGFAFEKVKTNLSFSWTEFSATEMATSSETELSFTFQNEPGYFFLDDVQVEQTAQTTPEPGSLTLFGTGLMGILVTLRRKLLS